MPDTDAAELSYDPELGPGYFVQTRSDFLRYPGYKPLVKLLYQVLLTYAAAGATAWPGEATLAEQCAVTEPTIRTALKTLQAAELLTVKRRGQGKTNLYHLRKLPLLPPNAERKKLPVKPERKKLPVKNSSNLRSRPEVVAVKVESEQGDSAETELVHHISTYCYQHHQSVTPAQVALLALQAGTLARWQAASAGAASLAEVIARLAG